MKILDTISGHEDLLRLTPEQRQILCREIRETLVEKVSKTGGHISSNLGVVELTVALETVFDTAVDRLVFDVGHQSYVHKLLTGRIDGLDTLRQYGGMAGFPKPSESVCDAFTAGHASTSVSVALGMARARTLKNEKYHVIALLGDGAATGGVFFEGLNDAAVSNEPMIIVLNDNAMSIDRNVGGLSRHLRKLRSQVKYINAKERSKTALSKMPFGGRIQRGIHKIKRAFRRFLLPPTIFESMGFDYYGPFDGHDTENLIQIFSTAKQMKKPVVIHVTTQKGRGYSFAEKDPSKFHGVGQFDAATGGVLGKSQPSFSGAFGEEMVRLGSENENVCAITAAMPLGTGLSSFKKAFPKRTFDVGIAEEHAVSMAGGLAKQGMVPVVAIYSTFLQRAYDMILQDVCMQNLHVVFTVDRSGLVGEDGETHHGIFDLGMLLQAPNMTVLAPCSRLELQDMLRYAVLRHYGPIAIRYPRGGDGEEHGSFWGEEKVIAHRFGRDAVLVTYGTLLSNVMRAAEILEEEGISSGVLRLTEVKPFPGEELLKKIPESVPVYLVEEVCGGSGIAQQFYREIQAARPGCKVRSLDLGEGFVTHGSVESLYAHCGLDGNAIAKFVQEDMR